jgi:hypothetical protein
MTRIALVVTYLIGMVVAVVLMDADGDGLWGPIWIGVSVLLGAATGDFRFAYLPLLAIPIAIPLGLPADRSGDPVFPTWVGVVFFVPFLCALIMISAFLRRRVDSHLRRRRAVGDSGVA